MAQEPRRLAPHQLTDRGAEDVLVGVDVDRSAVAGLTVGAGVHVDPGWACTAEQHALRGDVEDQQLAAVAQSNSRSTERATDGLLVVGSHPLLVEYGPKRVVQAATVGQVGDREACLVEGRLRRVGRGQVVELAGVHGEGRVIERRGLDGGGPENALASVVEADTLRAREVEG